MSRYFSPDDDNTHRPVTWWRGYPIYAAHLVVVVYVASMLATTAFQAFKVGFPFTWLPFSSDLVLHGQIWRVLTYGLVNPPSLNFALDMLMIVWFGREVERAFGLRKFLGLYGVIYLLPPLLFTVLGVWIKTGLSGETGALGLFIAFATCHPEAPVFFSLIAKWVAGILVGIFSLMALAARDWVGLISLWVTCGYAWAFVRREKGLLELPSFRLPSRKPKLRVLPDLKTENHPRAEPAGEASMAEIDALLDKIAQSGLGSLTAKERAKLEKGRESLLRRDRR
ncbi:MAG: rhomboid family intramembrane serine protease [Verrucomicrobia bacterium]|nr:rhomboid family intramembrane serine protease [Verrucomicrobiota bacterium]